MTVMPRLFQVRRAASRPGRADTLHALEWLGGEAFVATPPFEDRNEVPRRDSVRPGSHEDASPDWRVI